MNTPHPLAMSDESIVYVRPVAVKDLPDDLRAQVGDEAEMFAVHASNGDRLALVGSRNLAFVLARQNHMQPVNVH
ncbi:MULTISPECIES: DUF1150 family protein [unclassified Meridianimarinicoccus]|uniref:DUF1150 family protein n=1 Tax=unclassified Meridianimarinicoccus TaxID=2923344 RepID=UPI001868A0D5|nr:DUF1150 family protein [Fluviibacterium sp. MJW13]